MFTRQRKNYRTFVYAALIAMLCLLIVALLWPKEVDPDQNRDEIKAGVQEEAGAGVNKPADEDIEQLQDKDDEEERDREEEKKPVVGNVQETYYIVKKSGDRICVFFSNDRGEEIELESTDIVYELLTPEDQQRFEAGIKAASQEELSSILQDFES